MQQKDEITTLEFNRQLKLLSSFIYGIASQYFRYLKKYWAWMIFILIIVTAAVGYYACYTQNHFYGKASYSYNFLQKKTYGEMINDLNKLVETHSYTQLQSLLPIDAKSVEAILKINAQNIYGSPLTDDMNEKGSYKIFYITVEATNNNVFSSLVIDIENYLNSNVAVQEYVKRNKEKFKESILYRKEELQIIDSMQLAYTNSLNKPSTGILPVETKQYNPVQVFDKGEKATEEIADMQAFLQDPRAVKLQAPFLVSNYIVRKPLSKLIAIGLTGFLVLSSITIFILFTFSKKNDAA